MLVVTVHPRQIPLPEAVAERSFVECDALARAFQWCTMLCVGLDDREHTVFRPIRAMLSPGGDA